MAQQASGTCPSPDVDCGAQTGQRGAGQPTQNPLKSQLQGPAQLFKGHSGTAKVSEDGGNISLVVGGMNANRNNAAGAKKLTTKGMQGMVEGRELHSQIGGLLEVNVRRKNKTRG